MNIKHIAIIIALFVGLFSYDYVSFGLSEEEMEQQAQEFIDSWDIDSDVLLESCRVTEKLGARFYLGELISEKNKGAFIIGYQKHWFANRFKDPFFLIDKSGRRIIQPCVPIESGFIKYLGYLEDGREDIVVKTVLNSGFIWSFALFMGAFFIGTRLRSNRRRGV